MQSDDGWEEYPDDYIPDQVADDLPDDPRDELEEVAVARCTAGSPIELGCRAMLDIVRGHEGRIVQHDLPLQTIEALRGARAVHSEGSFWIYDPMKGVWSILQRSRLAQQTGRYEGSVHGSKPSRVNIAKGTIESAIGCVADMLSVEQFFEAAPKALAIGGHTYTIERNTMPYAEVGHIVKGNHSPDNRLRFHYDCELPDHEFGGMYESAMSNMWLTLCPKWVGFLDSVQPFLKKGTRFDAVEFLRCLTGVAMFGMATQYQTGALLLGTFGGANGKSTLMKLLRDLLFPPGSVVSSDPEGWAQLYDLTPMVGALANIVDEIGTWGKRVGTKIKLAVAGNQMSIRFLGSNPTKFTPIAAWILGCNEMPDLQSMDAAVLRRFALLEFDQTIDRDRRISEDVLFRMIEEERAAILLYHLHAAAWVVQHGRLPRVAAADEMMEQMKTETDHVRRWIGVALDFEVADGDDGALWVPIERLYMRFIRWWKEDAIIAKRRPISQIEFGRRMAEHTRGMVGQDGLSVQETHCGMRGKLRVRSYLVRLKNEVPDEIR